MWSNSGVGFKYRGGLERQHPALFGWLSKHILGDKLCELGFEDRAGVHQAAWNTRGKWKDVLGNVSNNLASPEKGHQEHI